MMEKRRNGSGEHGVFATRPIPRGTVIVARWHDEFYRDRQGWAHLTAEEVLALAPPIRELFFRYGLDEDFDRIVGPLDARHVTTLDNFLNHSCDPNLTYDEPGNVVAARDIAAGEELLIDYGCFVVNFDEPFPCRCGSPACRGRVTRQDWRLLARRCGMKMPPFLRGRIRAMLDGQED